MSARILVIRFGALGDIILTAPALFNLRLAYPEHEFVYLTKEAYRPVVQAIREVDRVVTLPPNIGFWSQVRLFHELEAEDFDLVVDLHGKPRSWLARKIVGGTRAVVYPKRRVERYRTIGRRKQLPASYPHTIDLYNEAVVQAGGKAIARRPCLAVPDNVALPGHLREREPDRPLVVVAPAAAHPTKEWPLINFGEVALALQRDHGATIVWATPDEGWAAPQSLSDEGRLVALQGVPIMTLAAVIAEAQVVLANDSGVAHLASGVGTTAAVLFGPTHPVLGFAPRGIFDQVLQVTEACRPCSLHGKKACYRERRYCLERLNWESVSTQVEAMLSAAKKRQPALLVDRDGTLIKDKHYLSDPDGIELIDGVTGSLKKARQLGYRLVVLSNQSGVGRGYFDIETVATLNRRLLELLEADGVEVDGVYYCPHYPGGADQEYGIRCNCRKPAAGMAEAAAEQLDINLRKSIVVGDKLDDVNLAANIGARAVLVRTGHGARHEQKLSQARTKYAATVIDSLADLGPLLE